jgi:hypothetical protein
MPILILIPMLFSAMAQADPIFIEDGGTHDVSSSVSSYVLQNGTLNIRPGSEAVSVSAQSSPGDGAAASVRMTGGQVNAGIDINRGSLEVSGGLALGLNSSLYGGDGVTVFWGQASITGGTFTGGNTSNPAGQAGSGVVGSAGTWDGMPVLSTLNISGGTFSGGTGAGGYYGGSTGYSLVSLGNTTITGGHFLSPIAINTAYGGQTDFLGAHLTYHDQILSGLLLSGAPISVRIYPDFANAVVNATGTEVRFSSSATGPIPPVPEASSVLIFGALGGALALARHRRPR